MARADQAGDDIGPVGTKRTDAVPAALQEAKLTAAAIRRYARRTRIAGGPSPGAQRPTLDAPTLERTRANKRSHG